MMLWPWRSWNTAWIGTTQWISILQRFKFSIIHSILDNNNCRVQTTASQPDIDLKTHHYKDPILFHASQKPLNLHMYPSFILALTLSLPVCLAHCSHYAVRTLFTLCCAAWLHNTFTASLPEHTKTVRTVTLLNLQYLQNYWLDFNHSFCLKCRIALTTEILSFYG